MREVPWWHILGLKKFMACVVVVVWSTTKDVGEATPEEGGMYGCFW